MSDVAWLIDDSGECHHSGSAALRASLQALSAGPAFSDYVIKNLGFVGLKLGNQRSGLVKYRPETVAPMAFARLMYWLADEEPSRVLITTYMSGDWQHEIYGCAEAARRAILARVRGADRADGPIAGEEVLTRPAALASLPVHHPLQAAFRLWRHAEGHWLSSLDAGALKEVFAGRFVLFERTGSGDFVLARFGTSLPDCAVDWFSRAVGHRVQDVPDKEYGWSCAMAYEEAVTRDEPALHDVDALVRWTGQRALRRRYKRLLLPFRSRDARRYLLSVSAEDSSIDLRRRAG